MALLQALALLDRQNVSSDVHECLQHVHSSFAERGCRGLSTHALCTVQRMHLACPLKATFP